jgi:hypothetical protein
MFCYPLKQNVTVSPDFLGYNKLKNKNILKVADLLAFLAVF